MSTYMKSTSGRKESRATIATPSCGCSGKSKTSGKSKSYGASEADFSCISGQLVGPCANVICEDVLENPHYYTHDSRYITACHDSHNGSQIIRALKITKK